MKSDLLYKLIVAAAILACLIFMFVLSVNFFQSRALDRLISAELAKNKIYNKDLVGKIRHVYVEKRYWVSSSFPFEEFEKSLEKALQKSGLHISSVTRSSKESSVDRKRQVKEEVSYLVTEPPSGTPIFRLTLIRKIPYEPASITKISPPPVKVPLKRPRIAIVLDDWGYNLNNLDEVLQIGRPLTLSILPNLPYSETIARKAKENNLEVILHMSMEPKGTIRLELNTLYTSMNDAGIRSSLAKALESVPFARGVSNHEGSKATEDERLMSILFGELKKNDMFFLDSVVTSHSVAASVAKKTDVKFVKRSIFLDNESDPAYIKKQFARLMNIAVKTGNAVGIGHDKPNTVAVLKEMIPALEEKGIELTYVSELAR